MEICVFEAWVVNLFWIYVTWFQGYTSLSHPQSLLLLCVSCQPPLSLNQERQDRDAESKRETVQFVTETRKGKATTTKKENTDAAPSGFSPTGWITAPNQQVNQCRIVPAQQHLSLDCNTMSSTESQLQHVFFPLADRYLHMPTLCLSCGKKNKKNATSRC